MIKWSNDQSLIKTKDDLKFSPLRLLKQQAHLRIILQTSDSKEQSYNVFKTQAHVNKRN